MQYFCSTNCRVIDIKNTNTFASPCVYLSRNNFSGSIPQEISNLLSCRNWIFPSIISLEISHSRWQPLLSWNLSMPLSIMILKDQMPLSAQIVRYKAFEGKPKLCGVPVNGIDADKKSQNVKNGRQIKWFHLSVALGFMISGSPNNKLTKWNLFKKKKPNGIDVRSVDIYFFFYSNTQMDSANSDIELYENMNFKKMWDV